MRIDDVFAEIEARHPEIAEIAHEVDPPCVLASNVIQMRTRKGITAARLAESTGEPLSRIHRIERGDANPRLITISKIAHALGVTLSELLEDNLFGKREESASTASAATDATTAPAGRKRRAG
ncbi:MAG TPA: helix-turn-helix transcriptional regulator [Longimicrobiaceae bacterium]